MLFELENVTKRKPLQSKNSSIPDHDILYDINLNIDGKQPFLLLGPSGSGKSTLLRMFNRLSDPDSGIIRFHGQNLKSYNILDLRSRVGYVSQVPVMLEGTVLYNFQYAIRHLPGRQRDNQALEEECRQLLGFLNVPDFLLHRDTADLSVGEKQRISVARTLIRKPDVLLLDEPTSALDPTATGRFLETIQKLRVEIDISIIMVTHSIEQAKIVGGDAALIVKGGIVDQGSVVDLIGNPMSEITQRFLRGELDN